MQVAFKSFIINLFSKNNFRIFKLQLNFSLINIVRKIHSIFKILRMLLLINDSESFVSANLILEKSYVLYISFINFSVWLNIATNGVFQGRNGRARRTNTFWVFSLLFWVKVRHHFAYLFFHFTFNQKLINDVVITVDLNWWFPS